MTLQEALINHGVIPGDIQKGMAYQAKAGGALEKILLNMGSFSEDLLPSVYSQYLNVPALTDDQRDSWIPPEDIGGLPQSFLLDNGWLLFEYSEPQAFTFVTKAPLSWNVIQFLVSEGLDYSIIVASDADFGLLTLKQSDLGSDSDEADNVLSNLEEDRLRELASEAPTVNLLNSLISRALQMRASDMHVEPVGDRYRIRYRIDGVLHDIDFLPIRLQLPIISRLKILSGMDISEKRRPQDGKIEMRVANISLDLRVSALPVNKGESMVLRFLRKDSVTYDMEAMDLPEDTLAAIKEDLGRTAGVILMTGPTGSGKTSTLYTFLNKLNEQDIKIITLEDPVEYQIDGLNQVQVKPELGFDFRAGLRSIVRQDPDVVMVGEIRDRETCEIAMQAALTGHLVFSTVHTNDAASAFTRLLDLGVEEFLLNAALISIIAQRLARQLCEHCAAPIKKPERIIKEHNLAALSKQFDIKNWSLMESVGCEQCGYTGFKGRIAITEYLRCDDQLRLIPKDDQFLANAKRYCHDRGYRNLIEDGMLKVLLGKTTIDEVYRVCG
jgi:general secretion pathway protein E